jgi:DNA-binding MarR family transcriptional regulator
MLDGTPKPGLGAALAAAHEHWRAAYARELSALGHAAEASGEVLPHLPPDGLAQGTLTDRMGLSKQAVQQLVDRLEAQGAVRREPDLIDKRMKRVVPTAAGLALLEARRAAAKGLDASLKERLGKKLYRQLRKGLRKLQSD